MTYGRRDVAVAHEPRTKPSMTRSAFGDTVPSPY